MYGFSPHLFLGVFLSGHRLGKETVGLNGAEALFFSISDGDTVWLLGNSLCDFIFILFLYSVSFSYILLSSFEEFINSSEFPRSFFVCFVLVSLVTPLVV